jgi:hypothetical protein
MHAVSAPAGQSEILRRVLQFLLHRVRRVLSLFPRALNVLAETVNRVASHVRAHEEQHH